MPYLITLALWSKRSTDGGSRHRLDEDLGPQVARHSRTPQSCHEHKVETWPYNRTWNPSFTAVIPFFDGSAG